MTETQIHPGAIVEDGAQIGEGCIIGPFCHVGPEVVLGPRVELKSHVVVTGKTEIGEETVVFPFAVIGEIPQDLKFRGESTSLVIGKRNRIREHVTMNSGTEGGGGVTSVGDDGLFMAGCHVAHDVQVGDRVILVNNSAVAGHCVIADDVIVGVGRQQEHRTALGRGDAGGQGGTLAHGTTVLVSDWSADSASTSAASSGCMRPGMGLVKDQAPRNSPVSRSTARM